MTPDEYWNGSADLVIHYRKANEIKNERKNQELWLQGLYFYEAIVCVSPVLHAFATKGAKPLPYPNEPYALTKEAQEKKKEEKEKEKFLKMKKAFEAWANTFEEGGN